MSQSPQSSCSFNPILSEQRTDALRRPTRRGGAKSKAEPRELCEQRREREISPSSLRSSRLNPHNQLDVPASVEYLNRQQIFPKLRQWTLGATIYIFPFSLFVSVYMYSSLCDFVCIALLLPFVLGFCLHFTYLYFLSIVFSACCHWWICFLVWLLSSFFLFFSFFYYFYF